MQHPKSADPLQVLRYLAASGPEIIVIGRAAAALHGSPQITLDVDVIRSRTPQSIDLWLPILADLDAWFRHDPADRRLRPNESHLEGKGALLLSTRLGPLDLLGALNDGRGYAELLPHTDLFDIGGAEVRVLDLQALIEVKAAAGREKDKLAVSHLLALVRRTDQK